MSTITKFDICSGASQKVGGGSIQSFRDGTREAEIAAGRYERIKNMMLMAYPWKFNTTTVSLTQEFGDPSDTNWKYKYVYPPDRINVIEVMDHNDNPVQYLRQNGRIFTNVQQAKIRYQRQATETDFRFNFIEALIAALASEWAEALNGEAGTKDRAEREAEKKLRIARSLEARQNQPGCIIKNESGWLAAHHGMYH